MQFLHTPFRPTPARPCPPHPGPPRTLLPFLYRLKSHAHLQRYMYRQAEEGLASAPDDVSTDGRALL